MLTIDLGALADNWRLLRDRSAPAECAAAVKADAYGIGLDQAATALAAAGCRTFFVAHLAEAKRLRASLPAAVIYVLNGLIPGEAPVYRELALRPVLGSGDEIAEWASFCREAIVPLPAALHVDTGLNRLGLSVGEALAFAGDRPFAPALLMSHFVASEEPAHLANGQQIGAFASLRSAFRDVPASLANSSGIFLPDPPLLDMVRPGYALYGGNPIPGRPNPMRPVVRLEARIIQTREIGAGESVGYGSRWTASRATRLATLSAGYADGIPRAAFGAGGAALVDGVMCPFVGNVSMDLVVVDVTDVPPHRAGRGAAATLIGDGLDIDEVGRRAGTIGYEVLTSLGRRFARRYLNG